MTAYMSSAEILARQLRTVEADAKEAADLTDADLKDISPERLTSLMDSGQLAHLGIGRRRTGRRH